MNLIAVNGLLNVLIAFSKSLAAIRLTGMNLIPPAHLRNEIPPSPYPRHIALLTKGANRTSTIIPSSLPYVTVSLKFRTSSAIYLKFPWHGVLLSTFLSIE
jgi:hypothetical protein